MQTVRVRLRKPTRVFTFLSEDVPLRRDEPCVVRSDRGLEYGVCVTNPEDCPGGLEERLKMNVVRKATPNDESTFHQLQQDEDRAKNICAQKIRQHNLPMKLVDVEYTFDKHKIVFYFTAAERVDFRRLVRDLAQALRTRIELRHIQVRDEAKLLGGLGMCGRSLCCATWLREFHPISMKMAKRQNLSLNPSKISGQCGRLLCCLGYEDCQYSKKKKAPVAADGSTLAAEGDHEPEETENLDELEAGSTLDFAVPGDFGRAIESPEDEEEVPSAVVEGFEDEAGGDEAAEETAAEPAGQPRNEQKPAAVPEGSHTPHRKRRRRRPRAKHKHAPENAG